MRDIIDEVEEENGGLFCGGAEQVGIPVVGGANGDSDGDVRGGKDSHCLGLFMPSKAGKDNYVWYWIFRRRREHESEY